MVKTWTRIVCLGVALAAAAGQAHGHVETSPTLVNRYLTVIVQEGRVDLSVSFLFGELPAVDVRRSMDTDGDGVIAPEEIKAERARWLKEAGTLFSFQIDGRPADLDLLTNVDLGRETSAGTKPATMLVEIGGFAPLPPGEHTLRIEPLRDLPRQGETDVMIDLSPDFALVRSQMGAQAGAGAPQTKYTFAGPRTSNIEDRSVTFVVRPAAGTPAGQPARGRESLGRLAAVAGLGLAVIAAAALVVRRRQRNRRSNAQDAAM